MLQAIEAYKIEGVTTTLSFGKFVFSHPAFLSGDFDTHFVKNYFNPEALANGDPEEARLAALVALQALELHQRTLKVPKTNGTLWRWNR